MIKKILLTLWQLPQILVGRCAVAIMLPFASRKGEEVTYYYTDKLKGGRAVTLGDVVLMAEYYYTRPESEVHRHEAGHAIQSKILGWLYLPIVGLCSVIHAIFHKDEYGHDYREFWTEKWADKLAKIK